MRKRGEGRALRSLAREPEKLGELRGRGGPFSSAERWAAKEAVPQAASAAKNFLGAITALNRHRGAARPQRRPDHRVSRRHPRRGGRTSQQLERTAAKLVKRLGWALLARVLPAPQYQLLRITLRVGRLARDAVLELQRGAER